MDLNHPIKTMTMEELVNFVIEGHAQVLGLLIAEKHTTGFLFGPHIMSLMHEDGGPKRVADVLRKMADKIEHELGTSRPKG